MNDGFENKSGTRTNAWASSASSGLPPAHGLCSSENRCICSVELTSPAERELNERAQNENENENENESEREREREAQNENESGQNES